ncbi:undecaprenyl diphosphate synthase family protein [Pseudoclavibacter helvolus]|uniref:undecaprenyl diphosphate synthase family protein n=1 Tax=Pseudoclavibacter helvolus TaxID=255205 RepID=UPI003736D534
MRIISQRELARVRNSEKPRHVAVVMDGNRRWADARGLPHADAYRKVPTSMVSTIRAAADLGIQTLSFFALSPKNLNRQSEDATLLANLDAWLWSDELVEILESPEICARVSGRPDADIQNQFPHWHTEAANTPHHQLSVIIAVNYSSSEGTRVQEVTDLPLVDLFLRAGGEVRLSDFALMQSAYAELVFTDTLWPDFTGLHLYSAVNEYQTRDRRYGL